MKTSRSSVDATNTDNASTVGYRTSRAARCVDLARLLIHARVQDIAALEQQVAKMSKYLFKAMAAQERLEAIIAEEMESARVLSSTVPRLKSAGHDDECFISDAAEQRRRFAIGAHGNDIVQPPAVRAAAEQSCLEAIEAETRQFHQLLLADTSLHLNRQAYDDDGPVVQAMADRVRLERDRLYDRSAAASSADELCVNTIRDTFNEELHDRHDRRRLETAAALQAARAFAGAAGVINPGERTRRELAAPPTMPIAPPTKPRMMTERPIRPRMMMCHLPLPRVVPRWVVKRLKMKVRRYDDDPDGSDEFND
ncbi:hypothetical protein BBJ28_00021050 [Nothophytophthora sp. Chile5]|nr:hypothetical protein BBJ28_00021050 [Nothophytophthora sp. Chile5]